MLDRRDTLTFDTHRRTLFPAPLRAVSVQPMKPNQTAKNETENIDKFTDFVRRLMAVPHSEIKARIEARKQAIKPVSRASVASPKRAN
jgi:hypothetical protein